MSHSLLPDQQPVNVHHLRVGDIVVTTLMDAWMQGSLELIQHIDASRAETLQTQSLRPNPPRITLNAYLLQIGDQRVLVDSGYGALAGDEGARMTQGLADIGVLPEAIDAVLITHLHPDHIGGLITSDDQPAFSNARILVPGEELDFWQQQAPENASDMFAQQFDAAHRVLEINRDRIERIDNDQVMEGVTRVALPGHTPGHSGYLIESAGERLLLWGDIVHLPQIQLPEPEAGVLFDVDGEEAVATRKKILEHVTREKLMVAGHHLDFPGIGHIVEDTSGYRFLPHVWSPVV
ncbi:MBL fold metallo-hydrolase [Kushneria pakistanensis]|uniref:MBL fold metallo-hydrolase n=1 Tax=Kushneria pakistanensis TaxID=1508770 RepID=A0ABQ3FKM1_9GAMM|nr:MBL fold metallo-hydrolase [Kushneria pakistanensis]GHC27043.1 MBL fold metallo-hydrolase [Kushneria pakistanensis]